MSTCNKLKYIFVKNYKPDFGTKTLKIIPYLKAILQYDIIFVAIATYFQAITHKIYKVAKVS